MLIFHIILVLSFLSFVYSRTRFNLSVMGLEQGLQDLTVDVPSASPLVDKFVALAVEDGVLPKSFLSHFEALAQS
jgi:hypothetical protein